jgi:hypothetical protein
MTGGGWSRPAVSHANSQLPSGLWLKGDAEQRVDRVGNKVGAR